MSKNSAPPDPPSTDDETIELDVGPLVAQTQQGPLVKSVASVVKDPAGPPQPGLAVALEDRPLGSLTWKQISWILGSLLGVGTVGWKAGAFVKEQDVQKDFQELRSKVDSTARKSEGFELEIKRHELEKAHLQLQLDQCSTGKVEMPPEKSAPKKNKRKPPQDR